MSSKFPDFWKKYQIPWLFPDWKNVFQFSLISRSCRYPDLCSTASKGNLSMPKIFDVKNPQPPQIMKYCDGPNKLHHQLLVKNRCGLFLRVSHQNIIGQFFSRSLSLSLFVALTLSRRQLQALRSIPSFTRLGLVTSKSSLKEDKYCLMIRKKLCIVPDSMDIFSPSLFISYPTSWMSTAAFILVHASQSSWSKASSIDTTGYFAMNSWYTPNSWSDVNYHAKKYTAKILIISFARLEVGNFLYLP